MSSASSSTTAPTPNLLETRSWNELDRETRTLIDIVTAQDGTFPVGSFKYKAHRYPADIDVFEQIKVCCDPQKAAKVSAEKIQGVARDISKRSDIYLGDFKAGLDARYALPEESAEIPAFLDALLKQELLTAAEYETASAFDTREDLEDYLRRWYVVRWTVKELLSGTKRLPKGVRLTLEDALMHDGVVKLDMWAPDRDGNYNEITNFFYLVWIDPKDGSEHVLNQEMGDYLASITHDIAKYGGKKNRNSLKLAKRLWNRAIRLSDKDTMERLIPLFQGGGNALNKVAGEAEVLRLMMDKMDDAVPLDVIMRQINGFRTRIGDNAYGIPLDTGAIYNLLTRVEQGDTDVYTGLLLLEGLLHAGVERYAAGFLTKAFPEIRDIIKEAQLADQQGQTEAWSADVEDIYD